MLFRCEAVAKSIAPLQHHTQMMVEGSGTYRSAFLNMRVWKPRDVWLAEHWPAALLDRMPTRGSDGFVGVLIEAESSSNKIEHARGEKLDAFFRGNDAAWLKLEIKTLKRVAKENGRTGPRGVLSRAGMRLQAVAIRDACLIQMREIDAWYTPGNTPDHDVECCYRNWSFLRNILDEYLQREFINDEPKLTYAEFQDPYATLKVSTRKIKREHLARRSKRRRI